MPSKFRIPKATIDGAYGAVMRRVATRMWGQIPTTPTSCGTTSRS